MDALEKLIDDARLIEETLASDFVTGDDDVVLDLPARVKKLREAWEAELARADHAEKAQAIAEGMRDVAIKRAHNALAALHSVRMDVKSMGIASALLVAQEIAQRAFATLDKTVKDDRNVT
jgi:hypothetical protein